jgi:inorganic pyrophosphatase
MKTDILKIPAFDPGTGDLNIVIETPRGSDHKYAYEQDTGMFQFKKTLPVGMVFPFNLGFVPSTLSADGDSLDALIITEARLFPGCLVKTRLLGAYKCEQKEKGKFLRNDRLIAVPVLETTPVKYKSLAEVDECLLREFEQFMLTDHKLQRVEFKIHDIVGARKAAKLIKQTLCRK